MKRIPVLSPDQATAWDRAAVEAGMAEATLMETAGRAVVQVLAARFAAPLRQGVLVACGPGNNGGDGWVVARVLHRLGIPVWATAAPAERTSPLFRQMRTLAREAGVRELDPEGPWPSVALLVDALLGTGARGAPRNGTATLVDRLRDLQLPIVAIDGPTGLDLGTGVSHGTPRAALTITFGGYRRGHLLARDEVGDVVVAEIGFPTPDTSWPTLFTEAHARAVMPTVPANTHKGGRGRVVVVGGSVGLTGAARLTGRAAFAAGAGLVHLLCPPDALAILAGAEPDLQGRAQSFDQPLGPEALQLLHQADAVVIGPGLDRQPSRADFVLDVLGQVKLGVVDADALTALQGRVPDLQRLAAGRRLVLTPHMGEFRTLFPEHAPNAATDPWGAASAAARASGCTVLLKGVPTVVAGSEEGLLTVAAGNPGLATGGSGDTLSGLIATFLAQGVAPREAAALAALVMGRAGEFAARRHGARAMRPLEVIAAVPELWRLWQLPAGGAAAFMPPILHELPAPAAL